jgi:hypothetical protein
VSIQCSPDDRDPEVPPPARGVNPVSCDAHDLSHATLK